MKLDSVKTAEPFEGLFPVNNITLNVICEHMQANGYDESQPIILWKEKGIVIDGHTRLMAAQSIGLYDIPVHQKSFPNEWEALKWAVHYQRDRNIRTKADIVHAVEVLDSRRPRGGDHGNQYAVGKVAKASQDAIAKSANETAKAVGVSQATVERVRTVLDHGTEAEKEAIRSGAPIKPVAEAVQERRKSELVAKPKFNETNGNVEWARWTWNPVTGCKHGCPYCYARDITVHYPNAFPNGFDPHFYPDRLEAPKYTPFKESYTGWNKIVFVCSMADLFGAWVPQEWIDKVFEAVLDAPQWNFLFLTKNPSRMADVDWPQNAWAGTTVDIQKRVAVAEKAFEKVNARVKFISCEPLREKITFDSLHIFDWLIIGGQSKSTGEPEKQPEWEWVESLLQQAREAKCMVYFKPNLLVRPKEYPIRVQQGKANCF